MPDQEYYGSPLGGHTDLLFSHPVYWTGGRAPNNRSSTNDPKYGKVYHIGNADDLMEMARREDVLINMPHPRTKGSTGYPDSVKDLPFFNDPHYQGVGFRWGMGLDRSEERLCEYRCQPLLDDMSNWVADKPIPPKYHPVDFRSAAPAARRRDLRELTGDLRQAGPAADARRREPGHSGADARRFVRHVGRSADPDLQREGHRRPAHDRGRRGMDIPAELRRGGVGRRHDDRTGR